MRVADYTKGNVAYNKELSPVAWEGNELRTEVRYKLLQIAKVFIDYLEVPGFRVLDIVLTGSMANYNYTKFSDFDIHVVTKYADLQCDNIAEAFYTAKKKIWNDAHDILVKGHEAELYVEDVNEPPVSAGVFSLLDNKWLSEPSYNPPSIDDRSVNSKVRDLMVQIDHAVETANDPDDIKRVFDKIKKMRRSGLDAHGEFGVENLAFKILRNEGYIGKLSDAWHHQQDLELSLDEHLKLEEEHVKPLQRGSFTIQVNGHAFDRTVERNVNPHDVDKVLNQVPAVKAKIKPFQPGEEFWLHNEKLGISVGFKMIDPDSRVIRLNTVIQGRTHGDLKPTIEVQ